MNKIILGFAIAGLIMLYAAIWLWEGSSVSERLVFTAITLFSTALVIGVYKESA